MKKAICILALLVATTGIKAEAKTYPSCGIVKEIAPAKVSINKIIRADKKLKGKKKVKCEEVTIVTQNGHLYSFYSDAMDCMDWHVGDMAAVVMDNNKTSLVYDDKIVKAKFVSRTLFEY